MWGGSSGSRICIRFLEKPLLAPVQASWKPPNGCPSIWKRVTLIDLSLKPTSYFEKLKWLFDTLESLKGRFWWLVRCLAVRMYNVTFSSEPIRTETLCVFFFFPEETYTSLSSPSWWTQDLQVIQGPQWPLVAFHPMFQIFTGLLNRKYPWKDWC